EKKKNKRKKTWIKILFGVIIGASAVIVVSFSDISGIKMISNIGGFPALWVEILVIIGILKIMKDPRKYDEYKEDYDENGRYLPLPEEQETENVQQKPPEYS
ncbi:MAG TPA: BCCT family transporter, partial [Candidatus Scatomonas merdavium]|nr:BCCT family transporter [Candidatus Scatomonas merdavium]